MYIDIETRLREFIGQAIYVPYVPCGRTMSGWDCWGLVVCAFQEVLCKDIPQYLQYEDPRDTCTINNLIQDNINEPWELVEKPQLMDVVLLKSAKHLCHIGLYIGKNEMLHADTAGTVCESLKSPLWRNRVECFGRYMHD